MQRLDYHVTVMSNCIVQATLNDGKEIIRSEEGLLYLDKLELITKDYLPMLDASPTQTRDRLERFGKLLYELLFTPIKGHFQEQAWRRVAQASPGDCHLALALTFQEGLRADIVALPWEFLYCEFGHTFLATDARVSFSRYYSDWSSPSVKYLTKEEPVRILLVRVQPQKKEPVALKAIANLLDELTETHTNLLAPHVMENPTPLEVENKLKQYQPHIVHFLLHGHFTDRGTHFAMVDDTNGTRWYGDRSFADFFTGWRPHVVILQACEGGRSSDLLSFANGAASLVRNHIPSVIAMYYPITNHVGSTFAQTFYSHLMAENDIDASVQQARHTLAKFVTSSHVQDDHLTRDFAAPIIWIRPEARQLFEPTNNTATVHDIATAHDTSPTIDLMITTPYGDQYRVNVSGEMLVDSLLSSFLSQWHPPATSHRSQRYSLALKLDSAYTLSEVGLGTKADLMLVPESLEASEPISVMVENDKGERYTAAVWVSTHVRKLAEEFFSQTENPGPGEILVEWVSDPTIADTKMLQLDVSLYDQGVNNDSLLRIYRMPPPSEEGVIA